MNSARCRSLIEKLVDFAFTVLFGLLCFYWLVFAGYTTYDLANGGTSAVLQWYQHITLEGRPDGIWSLSGFLMRHLILTALTGGSWFMVRRSIRRPHELVS